MKFAYQEKIDFEENVAISNIISKKFHKNKMLPFDSVKCVDGRTPQLTKISNNVLILISCKYKLASRSTYNLEYPLSTSSSLQQKKTYHNW